MNQRNIMKEKNMFKREKIACMVIGCLLLSSCASDGHMISIPEAIANKNWTGHPISEAIGKWGKPFGVTPAADGTTLYEWGTSSKYIYNANTGTSYSSDGVQTNYYQKQVGTAQCHISINADSNGIITHFETTQSAGGCTDLYWGSNSASPDAASAAKGKLLVENMAKAKQLNENYQLVCTKPDYAELFSETHCDDYGYFTLGPDVHVPKLTPKQKDLFAKWRAEMESVVSAYLVFLRSTGDRADKAQADAFDLMPKPVAEKYNGTLINEHRAASNAQRFSAYVKRTYLQ